MIQISVVGAVAVMINLQAVFAQKLDQERMERDIAVAENVLGTLIKQQFNSQRTFFPLEIKGNYQAGHGVVFSLPADYTTLIVFSLPNGGNDVVIFNEPNSPPGVRAYNYSYNYENKNGADNAPELADEKSIKLKDKSKEKRRTDMDSVRNAYNLKVIDAAKTFIVDYGDMIAQLTPQEKIVVSNPEINKNG
jgi:hypothetical protein